MSFDTAECLRKATGRAKSDVANKLISMFLHEVSRKICGELELSVNDSAYGSAVRATFGDLCCYCGSVLEKDRAAVEHIEGMNRFRVGLHIPGNVVVSCKRCNGEKRRDDQAKKLVLESSGWQSFLSHDAGRCESRCKSCAYWATIWPDNEARRTNMKSACAKILKFRDTYPKFQFVSTLAKDLLPEKLDKIYRACQQFAVSNIEMEVTAVYQVILAQVKASALQEISSGAQLRV